MTKIRMKPTRKPQDATLRNVRASVKRDTALEQRVTALEAIVDLLLVHAKAHATTKDDDALLASTAGTPKG